MSKTIEIPRRAIRGAKPRARERVLAYLEAEFQKENLAEGARLPTSRALASQLQVSVSTVQSVFQSLAKKGVISTAVGSGSFLVNPLHRQQQTLRIGVTFGASGGDQARDLWKLGISGAILDHSGKVGGEVSVVPITLPQQNAEGVTEALRQCRARVDGVIMGPVQGVCDWSEEPLLKDLPMVYLNPPSILATSNFVSADYLGAWYAMGKALLGSGRKRIVNLIGEMTPEFCVSDVLRNAGLTMAIGLDIGKGVHYEIVSAKGHWEENGYLAAKQIFSRRGPVPDAVVAGGDQLALGVRRYCQERGISVPEEVSILGGTGVETAQLGGLEITRACQPLDRIGIELVEMLCRIIRSGGQPQPARYLPVAFRGGQSTRKPENELLGIPTD